MYIKLIITMLVTILSVLVITTYGSKCYVHIDGPRIVFPDEYVKASILVLTDNGTACSLVDGVVKCVEIEKAYVVLPNNKVKSIGYIGTLYKVNNALYFLKFKIEENDPKGTYIVVVNASIDKYYCADTYTFHVSTRLVKQHEVLEKIHNITYSLNETLHRVTSSILALHKHYNETVKKYDEYFANINTSLTNLLNLSKTFIEEFRSINLWYNRTVIPYFNKSLSNLKYDLEDYARLTRTLISGVGRKVETLIRMHNTSVISEVYNVKRTVIIVPSIAYAILAITIIILAISTTLLVINIVKMLRKRVR